MGPLILSSKCGGGHMAAAASLTEIFPNSNVWYPWIDIEQPEIYNSFQRAGATNLVCGLSRLQPLAELMAYSRYGTALSYIRRTGTGLILSVIPVGNSVIQKAALRMGIKFVIIPTDIYCCHFFHEVQASPNLRIGLAFPEMIQYVPEHLRRCTFLSGYPVRQDFRRMSLNSGSKDPGSVMILMGNHSNGNLVKDLVSGIMRNVSLQVHLRKVRVMTGSNDSLYRDLLEMFPNSTVLQIFGYVQAVEVASCMSRSTVLVTKPGGSTLNEAMCLGTFMMLWEPEEENLIWESVNLEFCVRKGLAVRLEPRQFAKQLTKILSVDDSGISSRTEARNFDTNLMREIDSWLVSDSGP